MKIIKKRPSLWRRHPTISRVVLATAIGCFYLTFSGNNRIMEEQQAKQLERLASIGSNLQENSAKKPLPDFPGYPLTKQSMMAVGAQLGQSAVASMRAKQQKQQQPHSPQDPPVWCRRTPAASTNFLVPNINTTSEGLFFVKTPKTASQSINRILRRSTSRMGQRTQQSACFLRGHHIQGNPAAWYSHRNEVHSVLLTSLRDPAPRALSRIYWTLSTRQFQGQVGTPMLQKALTQWTDVETGCISEGQGGFQLRYVSFPAIPANSAWTPRQPDVVQNPTQIHAHVQQVLEDYDFVLVQERLDESLVAMQLLLGLQTSDILSMPLHVGGSYLYDRHAGCLELFLPPKVEGWNASSTTDNNSTDAKTASSALAYLHEYLQSPTWYAQNYGDYVLLGAAEASLNATIRDLGRVDFEEALQDFRQVQKVVLEVCSHQVIFPCSINGTIQRDDYQIGSPMAAGDRYPQKDIEACIDQVVRNQTKAAAIK